MICGGIFFKFNNIVNWWHAALSSNYISTGAAYQFQKSVIKHYHSKYDYYDLGLSGGHKGVEDFKRRIGSKILSTQIIERKPRLFKMLNK